MSEEQLIEWLENKKMYSRFNYNCDNEIDEKNAIYVLNEILQEIERK